ncbi:SAM-dependent methyltransferase [Kitasatospora sp. NPDC048540]|uniref:SAM-dependent methyltransferase n=1 Tax=Kitasatospora sp. NPDC048540 TaxID=3155634 RepID=UPI0033ED9B26
MSRPKHGVPRPAPAAGPDGRPAVGRGNTGVVHVHATPGPESTACRSWYLPAPRPGHREDLRTDRPTSARLANLTLGGKDHLPPDRNLLDLLRTEDTGWSTATGQARQLLHRAVRRLAEDGLDQFADLGCGLTTGMPESPLAPIHTSVLPIRPAARIVYVDADPIVMTHARALLRAPAPAQISHIRGDLTSPPGLLRVLRRHSDLDWQRPVAVILADVLHELTDPQAHGLLAALRPVLPRGSVLVLSHRCPGNGERDARVADLFAQSRLPWHPRGRDAVDTLLDGWKPGPSDGGDPAGIRTVVAYGGTK